jgi:hypothetical protein
MRSAWVERAWLVCEAEGEGHCCCCCGGGGGGDCGGQGGSQAIQSNQCVRQR